MEESINNAIDKAKEYYYNIMEIEPNGEYESIPCVVFLNKIRLFFYRIKIKIYRVKFGNVKIISYLCGQIQKVCE